jgi:hypothetical protein
MSANASQLAQSVIPNFGVGNKVRTCKYYFLQLDTLFTGTLNESTSNQSQVVEFPLNVRGATTELNLYNQITIQEPSRYNFSFQYVPFLALAYQTSNVLQYNYWTRAYPLAVRQPLLANFVNSNADIDGNLIMFCEKADTYSFSTILANSKPYFLQIPWKYTGTVNQVITATNQATDLDLLIFGAAYSGGLSNNTFRVTDMSINYSWSANFLRPQYFFGMAGQVNPVLSYRTPYFLGRNEKLQIQTQNVSGLTASEYITFFALTVS